MLLGIRWEKNALAETVPKDRQILATGDSNSIRSPIFRYFGKFGMNGRGHSPRVLKFTGDSSFIPINQKRRTITMIYPNFFQTLLERLFFLWAKIPIPCCPIEWKLPFVPLIASSSFVGELNRER